MQFFYKKNILIALGMGIGAIAQLKAQDTTKVINAEEIVISASRMQERQTDIPHRLHIIKKSALIQNNFQNSADMLQALGGVFVQKSQMGGGSPVIRGFEANKVLIVVDGIRMNNAIYRGGHLQNVISLDNNFLDRAEVLFGTGSTMYGSDALGGVMAFFTKKPEIIGEEYIKSEAMARFSSANNEKTLNYTFQAGTEKLGFLTSITASSFGDLKKGNADLKGFESQWNRDFFVERVNGVDVIQKNNNPNVQSGSAYSQIDIGQKILFKPKANQEHIINAQFSTTTNVPRYDRLQDFSINSAGNIAPAFSEWYYGPQTRLLLAYHFNLKTENNKFFDELRITPSYQFIEESRFTRRFNNVSRNENIERLNIFGLNADLYKKLGKHELRYGVEMIHNALQSTGNAFNLNTEARTPILTRYPTGSKYQTGAIYLSHRYEFLENWTFSAGLRGTITNVEAEFNQRFFNTDQRGLKQQTQNISYNAGITGKLNKNFYVNALTSSGFRTPNIDDANKLFEQINGTISVPNANLKPERIFNHELGFTFVEKEIISVEIQGFYSKLIDAIVTRPTLVNGQNTIIFNGQSVNAVSQQNTGLAEVYGLQSTIKYQMNDNISFQSNVTYTWGRDLTLQMPLDHIPPLYGSFWANFRHKRFTANTYIIWNGWKNLADYSPSGEDNLRYATTQGMPEWYTLNLKTSYKITEKYAHTIQFGVENIFDLNYRPFSSGINGAGRNFVVAFRTAF